MHELVVDTRKIFRLMLILIGLLIIAQVATAAMLISNEYRLTGATWIFNMDQEQNIPTLFSFVLFLACSFSLLLAAANARFLKNGAFWYWAVLSFLFALLGLDEILSIHERLGVAFKSVVPTSGALQFAWVIPYSILTLIVVLAYFRFVWRLPHPTRNRIFIAGALFVGGALGLEFPEAAIAGSGCTPGCLLDIVLVTIEETLEMTALSIFFCTILRHTGLDPAPLRVQFS